MMKLLKTMSVMLVVLAMTSASHAALVAHWTFDEAGGSALDSTGNNFHGTIVGTVTQGQAGQIGGAYAFSGAGWVDFGVGTVTSQIQNLPITISYWVKTTVKTGTRCAVWMGKRGTDSQYLQTGMKNGNANAAYRNPDFDTAAAWKDRGATATEADGAWHHIVAVYPDATVRHVYVDGVLAASAAITQAYFTGTDQVAVGSNNRRTSLTDPFDGLIDDVQIWDEALGAGAVAAIYAAGLGDVAANPLPLGNSVDPAVTTTLTWAAPAKYTPEVGYNLVLRKATQASEPNFAASDNIIEITNGTAVSPTTVSLDYDATYYWRVDSYEPNGLANNKTDDILHRGVVWTFTTLLSVPVITDQPVSVLADAGGMAQFQIGFESISLPQFAWYKS
ncbi:MAG: LamG domain-containing protein, partial [Anaerohalosphaeraceae bacterium]